jgi:twitching motility protein PilJ
MLSTEKKSPNEPKLPSSQETTQDIWGKLKKFKPWGKNVGIRVQLLSFILPTVLFSICIVIFQAYRTTHGSEKDRLQNVLKNQSILVAKITSETLNNSLKIPDFLAIDPSIIKAARNASNQVQSQKLNQLTTQELEQKFANTKLLKQNTELNNYLLNIGKINELPEIFFTDKNGYNVAYSNPTSDFVQSDEKWWQDAKNKVRSISSPNFDKSANIFSIDVSVSIEDPNNGEFLGVLKVVIPAKKFEVLADYLKNTGLSGSQQIQLIDIQKGNVIETITPTKSSVNEKIVGGDTVLQMSQFLVKALIDNSDIQETTKEIQKENNLKEFKTSQFTSKMTGKPALTLSFIYGDKEYYFTTIPNTSWVSVASIDHSEVENAGNQLIFPFLISALILGGVVSLITIKFANTLLQPIINLAETAQKSSQGNLDVVAIPSGNLETQNLANDFNNLINRVKQLLNEQKVSLEESQLSKKEIENLAQEQKEKNKAIQAELLKLIMEVEGVSSGDLTVRAEISEGEIGIVADFFNSIVENLRDIVTSVKSTTTQVNQLLGKDELAMEELQQEAIKQTKKIQRMLNFVEEMTQSIEEVAQNTQLVAQISQKASKTAKVGGVAIDRTVKSIVQLRDTVGETAKKVKRLGESSQQISKVISLINQIALQTNLLAINASIEAARAGEEGRGFAVVAEEVGELAAQSAEATKEIETIVEAIQQETAEVVKAMEEGTTQVVEGTKVVAHAKKSFSEITSVSQQIDELLQSISTSTISQTKTSEMVSNFMKEIAKVSDETSNSSREISISLQKTFNIARKLQNSVETFKID